METNKITIGELIRAKGVFTPLYDDKISPRLAFKIFKFCKSAEIEESFYNSKIKEIIEKYADRDESGEIIVDNDNYHIKTDKVDEFGAAVRELEDTPVDVPNVAFDINELEEVKLSVVDMARIEKFIKE